MYWPLQILVILGFAFYPMAIFINFLAWRERPKLVTSKLLSVNFVNNNDKALRRDYSCHQILFFKSVFLLFDVHKYLLGKTSMLCDCSKRLKLFSDNRIACLPSFVKAAFYLLQNTGTSTGRNYAAMMTAKVVKNCSASNAILWSGQVSTFNENHRFGRGGRLNIFPFSWEVSKNRDF